MHFYLPALLGAADGLQLADYVVVLIYMLVVVGIGLFFSRQQHSSEDFFLGGRNVPWFAAGISLIVSLISTLTYLGATGEVIRHGLAYNLAYWAMLPAFCVIIFAWLPFFMRLGLTSVYEYLERRYGLAAHWLGLALFTLILRVGWVAVIVVTLAKAAAHITHASATNLLGWEVDLENWLIFLIVTVGIVATLYTMLGGIKAVIAIDVLQYCVLMVGAIATVALVVHLTQSGPSTWWHTMSEVKRTPLEIASFDLSTRSSLMWVSIYIFFWYVCTYASDQVAMQRYFSMPSLRAAVLGSLVNFFGQILLTAVLSLCGMALLHYYTQVPQEIVAGITDPQHAEAADEVFPHFIQYGMPAGLSGLVLAALFAVALSSIDSGLSSVSTVLTVDLFRRLKPDRSPKQELVLARILTVATGVLVTGLAVLMMRLPGQWNIIDTCLRTFDCALGPLAAMFIVGMLLPHVGQRAIVIATVSGLCFAFGIAWWTELGWLFGLVQGESLTAVLESTPRPSSFLAMPGSAVATFLLAAVLGGFMQGPDRDKVQPLTWRGVVTQST